MHAGGIQATYNAAAQRVENTLAARAIIHLSPERVDEAHVQQTLHDAEMRNSIRLKLKARTLKLKAEKEAKKKAQEEDKKDVGQKETKEEWCARVIKKQGDYDAKHYNYWKQALAKRFRSDSPRESSGVPEDEWKRYFDDVHKRHYWHNHGTSESLWDRPESDDAPARVLADEAIFINSEDSGSDWD